MAGTTPTAQFVLSNYTTQTATAYPLAMDGNWAVSQRFVDNFAPRAPNAQPNMYVTLDAGHLFAPSTETLTELAAQTSATIVAPVGNPRIDRIVINSITGVIAVITGTASASPVAPVFTTNTLPIAQVLLQPTSTTITNAMITDERALWGVGSGGGFNTQATIASGATTDIGSTSSNVVTVSGTTTITSFGSSASLSAPIYILIFTSALTITNSANLLCPGSVNRAIQAGDSVILQYTGTGNWKVLDFTGNLIGTTITAPTITAATALNATTALQIGSGHGTGGTLNGGVFWSASGGNNGGSNASGQKYVTTAAASGTGFVDGDLWYQFV